MMASLPGKMQKLALFLVAACAAIPMAATGCATEEIPPYGDPAKVVGGAGSSTAAGGSCNVDPNCDTSFQNDVFPILENKAKCSAVGDCHGSGQGMVDLTPNDVKKLRAELLDLPFQGTERYVVPCDAMASKMLCNMRIETGLTNPHGKCGALMPRVDPDDTVDDQRLSEADLTTIEKWIICGAPDN